MMTSKDLEIVAKLACAYLNDVDAEKEGWFERVMVEVHRLESLDETAIKEANKAMNKTNRIADWIYAGREVALIVGGVMFFGIACYLLFLGV